MFVVVLSMPVCYGLPAIGTNKPLNLTADEQVIMERLDYDHAWDQLVYLSSMGEKTSGSPEERAAQQYVFDELTAMLATVGFADIRIAPKDASREFIRHWAPGRGVEDYIASATIEAVKPVN